MGRVGRAGPTYLLHLRPCAILRCWVGELKKTRIVDAMSGGAGRSLLHPEHRAAVDWYRARYATGGEAPLVVRTGRPTLDRPVPSLTLGLATLFELVTSLSTLDRENLALLAGGSSCRSRAL